MDQRKANLIRALLHGLTGAGLFHRLDYPGAPTHFVDPRSIEEIRSSGEIEPTLSVYGARRLNFRSGE